MNESPGLVSSRRAYDGRVISLDVDLVRFPDGSTGELEMVRHPGASAVVPVLSASGERDPEIVLIRQYRYAADGYLYEVPAGRLDPGEDPEACARRELRVSLRALLARAGAAGSGHRCKARRRQRDKTRPCRIWTSTIF
jgi:ADP-ribose pyrophosphatase